MTGIMMQFFRYKLHTSGILMMMPSVIRYFRFSFAVKRFFGYLLCIKKCRLKAEYRFRRHFDCLKRGQFYKRKEMLKLLINFRMFF